VKRIEKNGAVFYITAPQVTWVDNDKHLYEKIRYFANISYKKDFNPDGTWDITKEDGKKIFKKLYKWGHWSVLEHVHFQFVVLCSRACTHQLVRHRLASYTQRSQRYITEDVPIVVLPPHLQDNDMLLISIADSILYYNRLINTGIKPEDARYVLPNAIGSYIGMTVNLRELIHMAEERLCTKAQWEIRYVFNQIKYQLSYDYPEISEVLQPKCYRLKYCPMNAKKCPYYKLYVKEDDAQ